MLLQGVQFAGDSFPTGKITIVNKTGGALVKGGVYALDVSGSVATTVREKLSFVVAVSAANIDGFLVVATKALADGETGEGVIQGPVDALVDGDTTDVAAGDRLKAVAASTSLIKASEAVGSTDIAVGKALEANAGVAALKSIYFMGFNFNLVTNAAVS
jgi:hypothetical protein